MPFWSRPKSAKNLTGASTPRGGEATTPRAEPPAAAPAAAGDADDVKLEVPKELPKVALEDFDLLKVLGKGGFGKVMLVRKKGTTDIYAMKVLKKEAVIRRNQVTHTKTETHILKQIRHPFLTRMHFAFQSEGKLYMVLNYLPGGELFYRLKREGRFSVERVRLYAAEIGLGLGHLHSLDMIYRDLKPENILLDEVGHICLTDFGLSKESVATVNAAKTFCGTPEYLAPEILENKGHGTAVDWWSFGTLLYEMMCGLPPFYDTNVQRMYTKILSSPLRFPSYLSEDARGVLTGLLKRPVSERLGSGPTRFGEIQGHAFYKPLDFEKVYRKEYKPEFVPPSKNAGSAGNFDKEFTAEKPIDSVVTSKLTAAQTDKANFEGFTFNPHAAGGLDS